MVSDAGLAGSVLSVPGAIADRRPPFSAIVTLRGIPGRIEGDNLVVERYSAEGRHDRFDALIAEVVSRNPDVIVVNLNGLVKAFATATTTIPIVGITGDPIAAGLLTRLAHPGGNLTGVSIDAEFEIVAKRLQILKDVHQILNGAKPGDIPIYQPNKFQRIINLKAASALGLDPPSTLVARADGVIE